MEDFLILQARMMGKDVVGDEAALEVNKTQWPNTHELDWCSEFSARSAGVELDSETPSTKEDRNA